MISLRDGGFLSSFGYENVNNKTFISRKRSLMRAFRYGDETPLAIYRRLNALMILTKNRDPKASKIYRIDRDWFGSKFGYGKDI